MRAEEKKALLIGGGIFGGLLLLMLGGRKKVVVVERDRIPPDTHDEYPGDPQGAGRRDYEKVADERDLPDWESDEPTDPGEPPGDAPHDEDDESESPPGPAPGPTPQTPPAGFTPGGLTRNPLLPKEPIVLTDPLPNLTPSQVSRLTTPKYGTARTNPYIRRK